jgi:hypothetical protein
VQSLHPYFISTLVQYIQVLYLHTCRLVRLSAVLPTYPRAWWSNFCIGVCLFGDLSTCMSTAVRQLMSCLLVCRFLSCYLFVCNLSWSMFVVPRFLSKSLPICSCVYVLPTCLLLLCLLFCMVMSYLHVCQSVLCIMSSLPVCPYLSLVCLSSV